jgi:hypothetical protein
LTSVPAWRAMRLVSCALEDQGCSSAKAGVSAPALRDTGIITWRGEAMKAPAIALTGVFEYGSGRIGSVVRMVGDLTGPKPFRLSAPITPFCPEAVSPRALGCFRVSQKLGQRDLLWLTRGMLAGGHLFQPAAPSGYSDSSPPNSAPDFMSATLCDRMFRGRRELVRCPCG